MRIALYAFALSAAMGVLTCTAATAMLLYMAATGASHPAGTLFSAAITAAIALLCWLTGRRAYLQATGTRAGTPGSQ